MEQTGYYSETEAKSNAPVWAVLERLEGRVGELEIQTDRLRKQLDPLISQIEKPVPNGHQISGGVPSGSSTLATRLREMDARLEEIGSKVCRWCNELEI